MDKGWKIEIKIGRENAECMAIAPDGKRDELTLPLNGMMKEELPLSVTRLFTQTLLPEALPTVQMLIGSADSSPRTKLKQLLLLQTSGSAIKEESPLSRTLEVLEHIDENGRVTEALTESEINRVLKQIYHTESDVQVICFKNSAMNPLHESAFLNILTVAGYRNVYVAHKPLELVHLIPQTEKWVADRLLLPIIRTYLNNLTGHLWQGSSVRLENWESV
jgi:hypothetical protein